MYCSHFGLHRPPFNNTPDPSFYYSTPDHEEALATLQYATLNRKGFVLVTGEVGAGKTLIGRMFIRQIDRQASTAVITHTQLNARQLLAAICAEFELDVPQGATNLQLAERLQEYLLDQFARNRFVVVLLDEGQNLPDESFEALRMLGNLEADDAKLLQVCILGQPELRERFKSDSMRQLDQRLFRRFHLPALNQHQTAEYIQRRLSVAGCGRSDLFTDAALEKIYRGSQGIPRLINRVCDNALLAAYAQGRVTVDDSLVAQVLEQEGSSGTAGGPPQAEVGRHEETQARIEQIYGSRPEIIVENDESQAAADAVNLQALHEQANRASQQWPALQEAIEHNRVHMQKSVEEAAARCRQAEEQIATVARTAAPVEALDELRQLHQDQTGRVLEEIAESRSVLQGLIDATTARLQETESRLRETTSALASKESLAHLERRQEQQLQEALARVEEHRRHVEDLVQVLATQRRQTEAGIATVSESQARSQAEIEQRLSEEIVRTDRTLSEQAQQTAASVEALQASQLALKQGCDENARAEARQRAQDLADQATAIEDIYTCVGRHEDEIRKLSQDATTRFAALTRGLAELRDNNGNGSARVEQLRTVHEAFARDVLERFERKASELDELRNSLDEQLTRAAGEHRSSIAELSHRLDEESRQLRQTRRRLVRTHALIQKRIASLDERYAGRSELESLRQAQVAQESQISARIEAERQASEAELQSIRQAQTSQESQIAARIEAEREACQAGLELLRAAQATQESRVVARIEAERQASQTELETLRQAQAEQANEISKRIEANGAAVESLITELSERFRVTQQRIDALSTAAEADGSDLAELRRVQAEDVASLLRQLEDQRRLSQAQFEQTLANWMQAQREISSLREVAADASALEELRERQDRHSEEVLRMLGDQRQSLEALIAAANRQCDATMARLDALPANVASMDDVQTLQEEARHNKAALESAIHSVADQCEQTASALRSLEDRAVSVDNHLEQLRQDHAQTLDGIVQRLDGQNSEYQQEFDALQQRWAGLRQELASLAGSTVPVEKFEAAERLVNRDMDALKRRLDEVADRRQKDVRILVDVVQRLSDRVKRVEEADRPQTVRVELRPQAAEELATLNTAAQSNSSEMRRLLAECNAAGDRLREASAQVEQSLREWTGQAGCVQERSEQLRASAAASGTILQALRKCHEAIDNKLKSPAWHGQLHRAEELTARLEQVLPNYQEFEETVQSWLEQRSQAGALVQRLEKMLAESARATSRLGRVGALMAGVAAKDNIAEAVESAREHDEQSRPTRGNGHKAGSRPDVRPVAWPKYRTHAQANAG